LNKSEYYELSIEGTFGSFKTQIPKIDSKKSNYIEKVI